MSPDKVSPATKEARKQLFEQIKDDWTFNAARQLATQVPETPTVHDHSILIDGRPGEARDITPPPDFVGTVAEWRERSYASSEASSDEEPAKKTGKSRIAKAAAKEKPSRKTKRLGSPSATEGGLQMPDVAALARKRRRRWRLNEELAWNSGLAHWTAQRDAWCCARNLQDHDFVRPATRPSVADTQSNSSSSNPASTASPSGETKQNATLTTPPTSTSSAAQSPTTTETIHHPSVANPDAANTITIVPVGAPLFPSTDPTRSSITPAIYPSIYNKVVVQSLAPSVPINLADLIPALVQGWKRDGEWPPRSNVPASASAPPSDTMSSLLGAVSRTRHHRELLSKSSGGEKKSGLFHVLEGSGSRFGRKSKKLLQRESLSNDANGASLNAAEHAAKPTVAGEENEGDGDIRRSSVERKGVAKRVGAALRRSLNGSLSGSGGASEG